MTKPTISLLVAIIFIVIALSTPLIPCKKDTGWKGWGFCRLDGNHDFYGTGNSTLQNVFVGGGISLVLVFFIALLLIKALWPAKKVIG